MNLRGKRIEVPAPFGVLPSLADGKSGEDGMIIYTLMVAAEGIKLGLAGTALLHSKKTVKLFDSMSPQGIPL